MCNEDNDIKERLKVWEKKKSKLMFKKDYAL